MAKLSIICPVYNGEKYLPRLIESILQQRFSDFEFLLINDGSKDKSAEVIKEFAKNDKRVKLLSQENRGIARTRNRGIKEAKGEYLMFVDDDDYVLPGYLEKYVSEMEKSGADIVIGGYQRRDKEGRVILQRKLAEAEWSKFMVISPWAKIYRTDFVRRNKLEFLDYGMGEDIYFNILAYDKAKVKIINDDNYVWFYNEKSISNNLHKGMKKMADARVLLDALMKEVDRSNEYVKYFVRRFIVWYLLYSGRDASRKELVKNFRNLRKWKKENGITRTMSPWSRRLKGEDLKIRVSVSMMGVIERLHLEGALAMVYCRGRDEK